MSRIGKQPISIPQGVTVEFDGEGGLVVQGPKGRLEAVLPRGLKLERRPDGTLLVIVVKSSKFTRALWGTWQRLVSNMIQGVSQGYQKTLIIEGVGYRFDSRGSSGVTVHAGFSHPVEVDAPAGIELEVADKQRLVVKGIDKALVGQVAASIRSIRKPEPYKGKGIRYDGEVIRRKQGKKAAGQTEA